MALGPSKLGTTNEQALPSKIAGKCPAQCPIDCTRRCKDNRIISPMSHLWLTLSALPDS
jgi:hypothetical protein